MVAGGDLAEVSDHGEEVCGPEAGDEKSIMILNRVLEWRNEGIAIEAEPRHVGLICRRWVCRVARRVKCWGRRRNPQMRFNDGYGHH